MDLTELGQGSHYKGYTLWKRDIWGGHFSGSAGLWGAYSGSAASTPWFTAKTIEDLIKQIDDALAEVPDPVY